MGKIKNKGIYFAIGAYGLWGLFPLYWKMLPGIGALEILANRVFWSFILTGILVVGLKKQGELKVFFAQRKQVVMALLAAIFVSINWGTYIFAVNAGKIVETSLGYYINPLLSVVLGMVVFKEKLTIYQKTALVIAAIGVIIKTIEYGQVPWISLILAGSFGIYGLLKKQVKASAIGGLFIETASIAALALGYMIFDETLGAGTFAHGDGLTIILLIGAGVVTTVPLLLFARGAKQLPLSILGLCQYLTPTATLILGVALYGEPFTTVDLIAFCFIWGALALYSTSQFIMATKKAVSCQ